MTARMRGPHAPLARLALCALLAALPAAADPQAFALRSSAFAPGSGIPTRYTCEGADVSPPLAWDAPPEGTRSFALVVSDPDAPDPAAPKVTWVHWVVYDIPADARALDEGAASGRLPAGARGGHNDWKRETWGGPCPPVGRHRYVFTLYALDARLETLSTPGRAGLEHAMQGHVLARAELIGTYAKQGR